MNFAKKCLKKLILSNPRVTMGILRACLKLHSYSLNMVNFLAISMNNGVHPKHRIIGYHKFFVDRINKQDSVLDIGCGEGYLTYDIAKKARKVIGVDNSKERLSIAKERCNSNNIEYIYADATVKLPEGEFDVVVLSNVLEHIKGRITFLSNLTRKSSRMLIRVPQLNRDWLIVFKKEIGAEWKPDFHFTEYTVQTLKDELRKSGWDFIENSVQFGEIWGVATKEELQ